MIWTPFFQWSVNMRKEICNECEATVSHSEPAGDTAPKSESSNYGTWCLFFIFSYRYALPSETSQHGGQPNKPAAWDKNVCTCMCVCTCVSMYDHVCICMYVMWRDVMWCDVTWRDVRWGEVMWCGVTWRDVMWCMCVCVCMDGWIDGWMDGCM